MMTTTATKKLFSLDEEEDTAKLQSDDCQSLF